MISKSLPRTAVFPGVFLLLWLAACQHTPEPAAVNHSRSKQTEAVKAFILQIDSAKKTIDLPGELLANENAEIRAKSQGFIKKLNVDIGTKVKKGQVLALIDAPEVNTRVQELNEKVKAARARYLSSKDYFDRIHIAAGSDGVIAPSELEAVKNKMLADSAEYSAALFAANSSRQIGNYLAIVAPYNGLITKRNIVVGSFVGNPGDKPIFELENNSTLRLQVAVPEIYSGATLLRETGELTTRALPDRKFSAKLVRKSGTIDNATRTETWEFEVPNKTGELKAGSYADVRLGFLRPRPSFVLPSSAVVTTLERKFVVRINNNTVQWVDVRTGFNMGDKQEIFGDLNAGDTLALKGSDELKPGTKLKGVIAQ